MAHSITIEENPEYAKHCISKVHDELRKVKPECYKPVLVSIGPYYHKCPDLKAMQRFKLLYLNSLLERRNKRLESREIYLSELAKLETGARKCYAGSMSTINDKEFTEMMLLDSCFVVEFIRKMNYVPSDENDPIPDFVKAAFEDDDPIGTVPWRLNSIKRDMILLENQLPYFVLSKFYDMTKYDGEKSLEEMAMSCFNASLPRPRQYFSSSKGKKSSEEMPMSCFNDSFPTSGLYFSNRASKGEKINHLLHLVHILCRPSAQRHDSSAKKVGKSLSSNDKLDQNSPLLEKNPKDSSNENNVNTKRYELNIPIGNHIGTVVELQEAGVNFKRVDKVYIGGLVEGTWNDYVSLFDIDFQHEVMKVPCFKVDASTETLLRNLIAYEQEYFIDVEPKYFTDFAMLMNQLIYSEKDTEVLRLEGIIMNFLGGKDELSQLFNRLTDNVCDSYKPYYLEVHQKVDKHCKKTFNILMAKLRHEYSTNPWASVSTVAAVLALLLTVAMFVVAILTLLATLDIFK